MRSGSPAALFAAVSRTFASASKVSMNRAVAMSLGPIGTRALAPIMRSGTGAFGSTCFWKFAGSTSSGSGQGGCAIASAMRLDLPGLPRRQRLGLRSGVRLVLEGERRIEALAGHLPGQLSQPLVEEEIAGQPGNRRRPAQAEGEELVAHARIAGRQLQRAMQRPDRLLLVAGHHQRLGQVDQHLGGRGPAPDRLLAEADAALP